jgi:hypothetical protein
VNIQQRVLKFVTIANWVLLTVAGLLGFLVSPPEFAWGIVGGGLIVTINFHLLYRTLKKALTPPHLTSHNVVIAKYYIRFIASGFILFVLISGHYVNPLGLFIGLSVVVVSIVMAAMMEATKLFKEAV